MIEKVTIVYAKNGGLHLSWSDDPKFLHAVIFIQTCFFYVCFAWSLFWLKY